MIALLRVRDFALLWFAGLISYAGSFALIVVLPLHIYRQTDSTLTTAGLLAATTLPRVLFGSIAGVFVDRWDRRWVMVWSDALRGLVVLFILLGPDRIELLYALAALQGTIRLFFQPAESALLPLLVGPEKLVTANAMNALNNQFGMLVGPAAGTAIYAVAGIQAAAIAIAVTFLMSALLISRIASPGRAEDRDLAAESSAGSAFARVMGEWRAGLGVVRRSRALTVIFTTASLSGIAEGVFITLGLGPFVLDVLKGTEAQVGWLATAQSVGGLIAGVIVVRFVHRLSVRKLFGFGHALIGLSDATTFSARYIVGTGNPAVFWAMGWMTFVGFPVIAEVTAEQSLMQRNTEDRYRGRVFGALGAMYGLSMLIGIGLAGVLGGLIGLAPILIGSALLRVAGGLVALRLLPPDAATTEDGA